METRVDYSLRPPAGVDDAAESDTFSVDGFVVTGGKPLPPEEIRFDVALVSGASPEDVYLAGVDGLPVDPMEAYYDNRADLAFAAARWNLPTDLDAPGQAPTPLL